MIRKMLVLIILLFGSTGLNAKKNKCDVVQSFVKYATLFYQKVLKRVLGKCG